MNELLPGEIRNMGQVLEPDVATALGDRLLTLWGEHKKHLMNHHLGPNGTLNPRLKEAAPTTQLESPQCNGVLLGEADLRLMNDLNEEYLAFVEGLVPEREVTPGMDFYIGSANAWHIDLGPDVRRLINLSHRPITIDVATEFDPSTYISNSGYRVDSPKPTAFQAIEYGPGEAVVAHNACKIKKQTPHRGHPFDGKVFLRQMFTAFDPII